MNRKLEVIESSLKAHDPMMVTVSSEQLAKSGLAVAWMRQAASALLITGMELERQIWRDVRAIKVALHERTALQAYGR